MELLIIVIIIAAVVIAEQSLYSHIGTKHISYSCGFETDIIDEGGELSLTETAVNRGVLPVPWMKAELTVPAAIEPVQGVSTVTDRDRFITGFFVVRSRSRVTRVRKVRALCRGVYRVTAARVQTGDLLGGIRLSLSAESTGGKLTVLPVPAGCESVLNERLRRRSGERIVNRGLVTDPFYTSGARGYTQGDPLSRIHWKATAHSGELMVRQEEWTAVPTLTIILNVQTDSERAGKGADEESLAEHTIRLCVQCIMEAMQEGYSVILRSNGFTSDEKPLYMTNRDAESMRYALAELSVRSYQPFRQYMRELMDIPEDASCVLITPYTDDAHESWKNSHPVSSVVVSGKGRDNAGIGDVLIPTAERSIEL